MTLPRLAVLNKHWAMFPPVHVSLVKLFSDGGGKPGAEPKGKQRITQDDLDALVARAGGALMPGA